MAGEGGGLGLYNGSEGVGFFKKENVFWLINQGRKDKKLSSFNIWNKLSFDKPRLFLCFGWVGSSPVGPAVVLGDSRDGWLRLGVLSWSQLCLGVLCSGGTWPRDGSRRMLRQLLGHGTGRTGTGRGDGPCRLCHSLVPQVVLEQ